jgi:hypothetical protein
MKTKATFLQGTLAAVSLFNILILGLSLVFTSYTGDLVLEGKIIPGEKYEGDFVLNNTKNISINFFGYNSFSCTVIITNPKGDISSQTIRFRGATKGASAGMILKPQLIGKYHIVVSGAESPSDLSIKSGVITLNNGLFFIGVWTFWFIFLFAILRNQDPRVPVNFSKEMVLVGLLISLVTVYPAIYYSYL